MIKAIFFDLDGTIRHNEPRGLDVFAAQAAELGLRVRQDDVLRAMRWEHYYWAQSRELKDDIAQLGRLTDEHWKRYSHRQLIALGASQTQADELGPQMFEYMSEAYNPENVIPSDLPVALRQLLDAGFQLAVLSNRDKPFKDLLDTLGLADYFAFALASGEVGAWKPDPEIFYHACKRLDVRPAEAAYVGDNWFADVVGAKNAGVTPVLYDPLGIFEDPDCSVIKSFSELPSLPGLNGRT